MDKAATDLSSPLFIPLCVNCPNEIFVNAVFKHIKAASIYITLPWPVPSPDEKRGGLGVGLAPPPRKKKRLLQKRRQKIQRLQSWKGRVLRLEDL